MLIECTIKRQHGTHLEYPGGVLYHFKPATPGGPHVCEVTDPDHIESLLAVPEAYRKAGTEPEGTETPNVPQVLQGDGGAGEAGEVEASPATPRKPRKPRTPRKAKVE